VELRATEKVLPARVTAQHPKQSQPLGTIGKQVVRHFSLCWVAQLRKAGS
jgi:hypothetical protein